MPITIPGMFLTQTSATAGQQNATGWKWGLSEIGSEESGSQGYAWNWIPNSYPDITEEQVRALGQPITGSRTPVGSPPTAQPGGMGTQPETGPTSGFSSPDGRWVWKRDGGVRDTLTGADYGPNSIPDEARAVLPPNPYPKQTGTQPPVPTPGAGGGAGTGAAAGGGGTTAGTGAGAGAGGAGVADPFAAFKAEFRREFGRDATDADWNNVADLTTRSNELIRTLPHNILMQLPTSRLAQLSNEDLLPLLKDAPNLIRGFAADRLGTFGAGVLDEIYKAAGMEVPPPTGGAGTGAGGGGGTPAPVPGAGVRALKDIFPGMGQGNLGGPVDFGGLTQQEAEYYLPWATNPDIAAHTFLTPYGINTNVANPFAAFAENAVGQSSDLAATLLSLQGMASSEIVRDASGNPVLDEKGKPKMRPTQAFVTGIGNTIGNALGQGRTTVFDQPGATEFLKNVNDLVNRANAGDKTLTLDQLALATRFADPANVRGSAQQAFNLYQDANAPYLNPFLRNNQALMNRVFQRRYNQFYENAPSNPANTFFGDLLGV